ncbi:hypothetical protein [Halobacteriovorax sp.]|uniref:hypothetical protein n=1 Tax=Halobacteriovorax sp. TaxID=2020862 RepID=UPI00356B07EB
MNKVILSILFLSASLTLQAQEAQTIEAPEYQNYEQSNDQSDQLEKLLEIPEVNAIYQQCNQLKATDTKLEISDCIWKNVVDNEDIKSKIASKLNNLDQDKVKKYESVNVLPLAKESTESQKKLEEYYYKNMNQQIFGDSVNGKNADGSYQVVDHSKFNTIYQNQLTKNVLTAISSFCIEASIKGSGEASFPLISSSVSKRNTQRQSNIKTLSKTTVTVNDKSLSGAQSQSNDWQNCFINAQYVCHDGTKSWKDSEGNIKEATAKKTIGYDCDIEDKECVNLRESYDYTKTRACELTNYLKVAKQNLKAVETISEGYNQLQKTGGIQAIATGEKPSANGNLIKQVSLDNKVDDITSVSSNEFVNESGFSEGVNSDLAELENCISKDPETGSYNLAPGAEESCKKYLNTDREQVETLKAEYALRLRGLAEKVKTIDATSEDTDGVEDFLKDQGYTDDEIGQTIEANTDIKALKDQIIARYENEKLELIKSMNDKMESTASTNDGVIDVSANSQDVSKLIKIHEELSSKTEQYAQLIHFNNVVSGFLDIDQEGKETRKNTASIQREIANSAFSEDNLANSPEMAVKYANQNENLEKSLEANSIELSEKDKGNDEGATLGVDKINNVILNYDIDSNQ